MLGELKRAAFLLAESDCLTSPSVAAGTYFVQSLDKASLSCASAHTLLSLC